MRKLPADGRSAIVRAYLPARAAAPEESSCTDEQLHEQHREPTAETAIFPRLFDPARFAVDDGGADDPSDDGPTRPE
jgi:hypothetical protein